MEIEVETLSCQPAEVREKKSERKDQREKAIVSTVSLTTGEPPDVLTTNRRLDKYPQWCSKNISTNSVEGAFSLLYESLVDQRLVGLKDLQCRLQAL